MPTYVYECKSCQGTFEAEQRITENALTQCILCEVGEVKRVIQPIGVVFKGAGFHINDYANSSVAPATKTEPVAADSSSTPAAAPAAPEAPAAPAATAKTE